MKYYMIEIAFGIRSEVEEVSKKLLDMRLVGSVQVVESDSTWNWQSKREGSKEYLMFLKTKEEHIKKIYEVIKNIHSYDCFEFATYEITSINQDYLKWIEDETK